MNTTTVYSTKAEKYAKHRWDYALSAVKAIKEITHLSGESTMADIGAGSGILTRHFTHLAHRIYALEPNKELRTLLTDALGACSNVTVLDGSAENTKLENGSVDVITAAQAIHWFDPEPARREMMRILKEKGWLVLVRNYGTNQAQNDAVGRLMTEEYGADFSVVNERPKDRPISFYYGNDHFRKSTFPFQFQQNWEGFIGSLTTASFMPDEDHPLFDKLEMKAREVFSQYSKNGFLTVEGETELIIGQPSK